MGLAIILILGVAETYNNPSRVLGASRGTNHSQERGVRKIEEVRSKMAEKLQTNFAHQVPA